MSIRNDDGHAIERARKLRRQMTALEHALWFRIRRGQIGFRFRRQYAAIPNYTLDFYCPAVKLCVEIDGPLHDSAKDARRDEWLARHNVKTIRFTSQQVFDDIVPVVEAIRRECEMRSEIV